MSRVLVAAGVIRAGRRVRDLSVSTTATAPAPAPTGVPVETSSPWCFHRKQAARPGITGPGRDRGAAGLDMLGGALLVSGSGSLLALMLLITAAQGLGAELVSAEILTAAAVIGYRAHRGGWRRWWTPVWRFLVLTGLLLAAAGILLPLRQDAGQAWRWDIAGWQLAGAVALALGLLEVPVLTDALLERDRTTWVLRAEHVVAGWVPFAGLLAWYPYAPVWAGHRHGLGEILPGLVCLLTVAAVVGVQARIEADWTARTGAAAAAGDVLDPATSVGLQLGRLGDLYNPWLLDDLTVALWLIPLGVRVRVATDPRMVVEGLTTGKRGDSIRIGSQWINTTDHAVTGLEILADDRTPVEQESTRTPALLLAPLIPGQPTSPEAQATGPAPASTPATDRASGQASPPATGAASPAASAGPADPAAVRPPQDRLTRLLLSLTDRPESRPPPDSSRMILRERRRMILRNRSGNRFAPNNKSRPRK